MDNLKQSTKQPSISDCLQLLDEAGWSELIDKRFSEEVANDLKQCYGSSISDEMIEKILKIVIIDEDESIIP